MLSCHPCVIVSIPYFADCRENKMVTVVVLSFVLRVGAHRWHHRLSGKKNKHVHTYTQIPFPPAFMADSLPRRQPPIATNRDGIFRKCLSGCLISVMARALITPLSSPIPPSPVLAPSALPSTCALRMYACVYVCTVGAERASGSAGMEGHGR